MAEVITCGVCEDNPSKYKCPHCSTRYCSIPCFKKHIAEHEAIDDQKKNEEAPLTTNTVDSASLHTPDGQAPGVQQTHVATGNTATSLARLLNDARFSQLVDKYPSLKPALRRIYRTTLHPQTQLDTRHEPSPEPSSPHDDEDGDEAILPSAPRSSRAKVADQDEDEQALERQWGAAPEYKRWTSAKAEERALKLLLQMQGRDEGVADFVELVRIAVLAPAQQQQTDTAVVET